MNKLKSKGDADEASDPANKRGTAAAKIIALNCTMVVLNQHFGYNQEKIEIVFKEILRLAKE